MEAYLHNCRRRPQNRGGFGRITLLDVAQLSDIVEVLGPDTFKRYIYAGNALATVQTSDPIKVITVRTTGFDAAPSEGGSASIERIDGADPAGISRFVGREVSGGARPELISARIVVSGGRFRVRML